MKKVLIASLSFLPTLAFAQADLSGISSLVTDAGTILGKIIPIMFALAIIYFFLGVVQFLRSAGDADAKKEGQDHMLWGFIAIFVMVSLYGLIAWFQSTLGVGAGGTVDIPTIPGL